MCEHKVTSIQICELFYNLAYSVSTRSQLNIENSMVKIPGTIVDLHQRRLFVGIVHIEGGLITHIEEDSSANASRFIMPGFVDAHVHIESSMLIPSEFARLASVHGTVATVSDPHEIANVCGMKGIQYMLNNAEKVPLEISFGAPSCVPATTFETAGAEITPQNIAELFANPKVRYLSEMMNWPGVLFNDPVVIEKLRIAKQHGRPIDGHAPGLRGEKAFAYAAHGISTDHECFTLEEAIDKIEAGMKIIIREGSAARNFDALHPLFTSHPELLMFCSDDMHPDSLVVGHINLLVQRAIALGYNHFDVFRAASIHPIEHYKLPVGQLRVGDRADFIVTETLEVGKVLQTWIAGELVAENGHTNIARIAEPPINQWNCSSISEQQVAYEQPTNKKVRVIEALDGQLVTKELHVPGASQAELAKQDVLKMVVVNRYTNAPVALAFIKNFGFTSGAIASSVAHDSHNIVAVGVTDTDICTAVNAIVSHQGGVSVFDGITTDVLPLPVAGLMSNEDGYEVAAAYARLDAKAKALGSKLRAPFMTLSFMALLVIPQLKLSDKGLFDGAQFSFVDLILPTE